MSELGRGPSADRRQKRDIEARLGANAENGPGEAGPGWLAVARFGSKHQIAERAISTNRTHKAPNAGQSFQGNWGV